MNIAEIVDSALDVLRLLDDYHAAPHREMLIDPVLYAYLEGRFTRMSRQHRIRFYGRPRPQRIDFRHGGTNPSVIEFAVRPPAGGSQLYGSQNQGELRKLTRVPLARARRRYLLLLDLYHTPIAQDRLEPTYLSINAGRGRFRRYSVRVVYTHHGLHYNFIWHPRH